MRRLTTPTHTFTFPDDVPVANAKTMLLTYSQDTRTGLRRAEEDKFCDGANRRNIIFEVDKDHLTIDGQNVSYTLTQNETKMFKPNFPVNIQMRVVMVTGEALASDIYTVSVDDVLDDKVL